MPTVDTELGAPIQLRDGTHVRVRGIRPDDAPRLQALFAALSPPSAFFRFLTYWKELTRPQAEYLTRVDYCSRMAFVATIGSGENERVIGLASYALLPPAADGIAEAAIVVEDDYQGLGLGTNLLYRLAAFARGCQIRTFVGTVHYENEPMLRWLEGTRLRFEINCLSEDAAEMQVRVELPTEYAESSPGEESG